MPNALKEQIAARVATKLATITVANGYSQTVLAVHRPPVGLFTLGAADCPALIQREEIVSPRWHIRGAEELTLDVEILCVATTPTLVANLMADVKKLVNGNLYWNDGVADLAWRTRIIADRQHESETSEAIESGRIVIRISADASLSDPTAVKPI